jgi:hypothetical protein
MAKGLRALSRSVRTVLDARRGRSKAQPMARSHPYNNLTFQFKRGMDAHNNPGFYRQLGKDPDLLLSAALELLARKFSL